MANCKKCNDNIDVDDTAFGCNDITPDKCIILSKDYPYYGIVEGQYLSDLMEAIENKQKSQDILIGNILTNLGL